MTQQPPPGWYPDGQGNNRYWNGSQWADVPAAPTAAYGSYGAYTPPTSAVTPTRKRWPWIVGGVVAVLVVLVAIGAAVGSSGGNHNKKVAAGGSSTSLSPYVRPTDLPASSDAPSSSSPPALAAKQIGESATITNDSGTLGTIAITGVQRATVEPGEFGSKPEHGLYLIFTLSATGGGVPFPVNELDFYVTGSDGQHFEDPAIAPGFGASFNASTLHNGEKSNGLLIYDVSPAAFHGKLYYSPNHDNNPIGYWDY